MKRIISFVLLGLLVMAPLSAQKFTKKEQARREAREANYFHGASFTFTAGYQYSFLTEHPSTAANYVYGKSDRWGNNHSFFNAGFLWDQSVSKKWGVQTGLYYTQKGGEHLFFYDNQLGSGPIARPEETIEANADLIELQNQVRWFFPVRYKSRFSVNAGWFLDRSLHTPKNFAKWNYGLQMGVGFDWNHLSVSATYQQALYPDMVKSCNSTLNGFSINVGYRLWKK